MSKHDLNKHFEVEQFDLRCEKAKANKEKVTLTFYKGMRSDSQNGYQHALFAIYGIEFGEKMRDVKKYIYKRIVNPDIFKTEFIDKRTGEVLKDWKSTADLDTAETTTAIERFRNFSAENGCYLPTPDEYREEKFYFEQQIEKAKNFI